VKTLEADVVVVAAGAAGLAAAVAAAEGGAKVMAFEKAAVTGGTGNRGGGPFAVESRLQRLKQIGLTKDEAFKIHMDYTHWRVDARLVKAYIDKSADTIDWLEKMGVEFNDPSAHFPGANFAWHVVKAPASHKGPPSAHMMQTMTERARALGAQIFLETPAKKILKEDGRIIGVSAEDKTGEEVQVMARAIVIATGGFGDNPEMIKKYTGFEWGRDIFSFRIPGLVGDGIRMAWEAGAAPTEMSMQLIYGMPGGDTLGPLNVAFRQPNLMVNLAGERFMNEEIIRNTTYAGNAIARQKNRCAFVIFDDNARRKYEETGFDFVNPSFPFPKAVDFEAELQKALDRGFNQLFSAASLEELAQKIGINPDVLGTTVEEYNHACDTGRDELFNKNQKYLIPIKKPQFYAGRFFPNAYGTLGGIKINYKTEVLNKNDDTIPGLFAAGVDACTIYGDSYLFLLPGNSMGFALNSGRIAGENAAKYVKSTAKQST